MQNSVTPTQVAAISRLFSISMLRNMVSYSSQKEFRDLVVDSGLLSYIDHDQPIANLFDLGLLVLSKPKFRQEYVYKSAIAQKVLMGTHSLSTATMMSEFGVGRCKADVVVLNGSSTVYEIKSERDKLTRLISQVVNLHRKLTH